MEWEEILLESTCSIIEDIQKGNIDEYGYISNEYLSYYTHKSPTSSPTFDSNSTEYKSNAYASAKHYYTDDDEESSKVYYGEKESSEEYYPQEATEIYYSEEEEEDLSSSKVYYKEVTNGSNENTEAEESDDYYESMISHQVSNEYYFNETSSGKSIKDYQTDLTDTINEKFMPDGSYVTEDQVY